MPRPCPQAIFYERIDHDKPTGPPVKFPLIQGAVGHIGYKAVFIAVKMND